MTKPTVKPKAAKAEPKPSPSTVITKEFKRPDLSALIVEARCAACGNSAPVGERCKACGNTI